MEIVKFDAVEDNILTIRGAQVILDSDVAELYGVETRDVNKAVKNNPEKFPNAYVIELDADELDDLRCKFSTAKFSKTRVLPKAFTEKGLYKSLQPGGKEFHGYGLSEYLQGIF